MLWAKDDVWMAKLKGNLPAWFLWHTLKCILCMIPLSISSYTSPTFYKHCNQHISHSCDVSPHKPKAEQGEKCRSAAGAAARLHFSPCCLLYDSRRGKFILGRDRRRKYRRPRDGSRLKCTMLTAAACKQRHTCYSASVCLLRRG